MVKSTWNVIVSNVLCLTFGEKEKGCKTLHLGTIAANHNNWTLMFFLKQNGYKKRREIQNLLSNVLIPHEANKDMF
jgi:hypothetical protein